MQTFVTILYLRKNAVLCIEIYFINKIRLILFLINFPQYL